MWEQIKHCHRFLTIKVILKNGPFFLSKYFHVHLLEWHAFSQSYLLHQPRGYPKEKPGLQTRVKFHLESLNIFIPRNNTLSTKFASKVFEIVFC